MATPKKLFARGESAVFLAIVAAVLVVLNVISVRAFVRLDLTDRRLFSLSDGSRRVAARLRDKLIIRAYFTEDLPPPFNATARYVRDLLEEYRAEGNGRIQVEYIAPDNPARQQQAEHDGVTKVSHQVVEREELSVKEGYRGISFSYLGNTRQIPVVEDTAGLEYQITSIIKELTGERLSVGLLTGHDEPSDEHGLSLLSKVMKNYNFRSVDLSGGEREVPHDLRALLVVGPTKTISEREQRRIDAYLMHGGSVGILTGSVKVDIESAPSFTASNAEHGLGAMLRGYGIRLGDNIALDAQCIRLPARGPGGFPVMLPYPAWPVIAFDERQMQHPVAFRLPQIVMPFSSTLSRPGLRTGHGVKVFDLMRTTEQSWLQSGEYNLDPTQRWHIEGRTGPFTLAVAAEGRLPSAFRGSASSSDSAAGDSQSDVRAPPRAEKNARLLVVGSSGFADDAIIGFLTRMQRAEIPTNLAFLMNSVDWLAQDADLVAVRAKQVEDPEIEVPSALRTEMQQADRQEEQAQSRTEARAAQTRRKEAESQWEAKKAAYKWGNMFLWPLLFAVFGVIRWRLRIARRAAVKL